MRRSSAPSFQGKKNSSSLFQSTEGVTCTVTTGFGGEQISTRSTSSILSLLNETRVSCTSTNESAKCLANASFRSDVSETKESISTHGEDLEYCPEKVEVENAILSPSTGMDGSEKRIYNVVWGKLSKKKHKKWEGDGVVEISSHNVVLKDCEGKCMGTKRGVKTDTLEEGSRLVIGNKEIELIDILADKTKQESKAKNQPNTPLLQVCIRRSHKRPRFMSSHMENTLSGIPQNALVMPPPSSEHQWLYNPTKLPLVDVIVDSCLSQVLRPHQRHGVQFLYECVCGMKNPFRHQTGVKSSWRGCILADEMGLGKTLQCITLIWTLLRKGPYGDQPMFHKALIVTPSSLVVNWQKEFWKWLKREQITPFIVNQKNKPKDYLKMPSSPVMIISYEMVVRCIEDLKKISFDILICDEGHRIKNTIIKTSQVLLQMEFKSRVLLTGTPIQNDLLEFFSLIDFVNPGILGSCLDFRKHFEEPIVKSRHPKCSLEERCLGETRAAELNSRTGWFVLRRTQAVINKYLPEKKEIVVFCSPSALQVRLYKAAIKFWEEQRNKKILEGVPHLTVLTAMKKICNHPKLILESNTEEESLIKQLKEEFQSYDSSHGNLIVHSGKLSVLEGLLQYLRKSKEKVILVSYYTQTLEMFAALCESKSYRYCRLDGSVPVAKRMSIVESFNQVHEDTFVFLLSARAGGVGLNLTGASRLVLYDSDWNPASDLQAMARIWRDGQKKSVYIYRLLTTGTVEEKVYQRQINKTGLSGAVEDPHNQSGVRLSLEELRDLFTFHENSLCLTHDMLSCKCHMVETIDKDAEFLKMKNEGENSDKRECQLSLLVKPLQTLSPQMNQLYKWQHLSPPFKESFLEEMGLSSASNFITFVFLNSVESGK